MLNELPSLGYQESVDRLSQLASTYPADPRPVFLLGGIHADQGKMDLAEACFMSALQRAPELAIARFQLGLLQFTSARPTVAAVTWSALDELPPRHALRQFKQAFELLAQDRLADAAAMLRAGMLDNTDNAPLNGDMQKVVGTIEATLAGRAEKAALDTRIGEAAETPVDEASQHYLMSVYSKLH